MGHGVPLLDAESSRRITGCCLSRDPVYQNGAPVSICLGTVAHKTPDDRSTAAAHHFAAGIKERFVAVAHFAAPFLDVGIVR
ncbi:MAG TPA: hypothetical protein VLT88_11620, partial [Desulfosarcina sp.]|nr:hypothetical protein [Desulfosarcina sp.]